MTDRTRLQLVLGSLVLALALTACGKQEQPPLPVQTQPAAPATTIPTTTTTLAAAVPTPAPTPAPVWRTLRFGMKKNEVMAALPREAQRLGKPLDFTQPQPGSRLAAGSSDLTIPSYEADGATFRVLFGFVAGSLNRIHLSGIKPAAGTCRDLETALTGRHGTLSERNPTGTSLKGEEIVWKLPDQTIVLDCASIAQLNFQTLSLDYLAPEPAPKN